VLADVLGLDATQIDELARARVICVPMSDA